MSQTFDVVIAGAGAAGLMCALRAGQRGRKVLLLDHADKVGKKILISGGGRCNFTNTGSRPEAFLSANPHFCKSALAGTEGTHQTGGAGPCNDDVEGLPAHASALPMIQSARARPAIAPATEPPT